MDQNIPLGPRIRHRNIPIEYLRLAAAFGIVWYHSGVSGTDVAYAGLAVFIIITFYLEMRRSIKRPLDLYTLARRIGIPWLFWMLAYAANNVAHHNPILVPTYSLPKSILAGSAEHLWYLPYVLFLQSVIRLTRRMGGGNFLGILSAAVVVAFCIEMPLWRPWSLAAGPPIAQYAQGSAAVAIGILIGLASIDRRWWLAVGIAAISVGSALTLPFHGIGLPYSIGAAAVIISVVVGNMDVIRLPDPKDLSQLTFGIYLIHIPIMHLLTRSMTGPALVTATFLVAACLVWTLRRLGGRYGEMVT